MTSRLQQKRQFNTAGLEADVMRFMAIIAFCLIAMTAMVKDEHELNQKQATPSQLAPKRPAVELEKELQEKPDVEARPERESTPESLTLRFASDEVFIHLISSGNLKLFAKLKNGYSAMDPSFNITPAYPSGELYEVMEASIPAKITRVFEHIGATDGYMVVLPEASRKILRRFIKNDNAPVAGALVIHKNGGIVHEL